MLKTIKNYEGKYSVTKCGRVYSHPKPFGTHQMTQGAYLNIATKDNGYKTVGLVGKSFYVHRLVASAYIPNPQNKPTVNHIDGNKANNDVSNLEWATYSENEQHAWRTGLKVTTQKQRDGASKARKVFNTKRRTLSNDDIHRIRKLHSEGHSTVKLGKEYGMAYQAIQNIVKRLTYREV